MQPVIVKGTLESCSYITKYDDNGNEYRQYVFQIDGHSYHAKTPRNLYLSEGMKMVLATDPKIRTEVLSGYSLKDGSSWGENVGLLKKHFSKEEAYEYVEGTVQEKRKFSSRTFNQSSETYERNAYFDIVLENNKFSTSWHLGDDLKPGMRIAAVLSNNEASLVQNMDTGKIKGLAKPYYILFILLMILFTGAMTYYHAKDPTLLPNYSVSITVINVFLFLAALLNFFTYNATQRMRKFLKEKQPLLK